MLLPCYRLMLLPFVKFGRCYNQIDNGISMEWNNVVIISMLMADVIAIRPLLRKTHITVTYSRGLIESFKNTCKKYGIQVYIKGGKTIRNLLVAPKDKEHITQKSGIIYRFKCDRVECDDEYIGELARTFGERFKEHLKQPSPIYDHSTITGHSITLDNFSIVGREEQNLTRLIKEAIFIRVNNPSLNKNIGKYHLPHIWDEVLNNITELKLK